MAPEFPYLRNNQAYTPYVRALENEYDFIAPQLYNQAGDGISIGTEWIAQNNDSRKYDFYMVFQNHSMKEAVVSSRSQQINWQ